MKNYKETVDAIAELVYVKQTQMESMMTDGFVGFEVSREALHGSLASLTDLKRYRFVEGGLDRDGKKLREVREEINEVKLEVRGHKLSLLSVGEGVYMRVEVPVTLTGEWPYQAYIADSVAFRNLCKKTSLGKALKCKLVETGALIITSEKVKNAEFVVDLKDEATFPEIPICAVSPSTPEINAGLLRRLISNVAYAAGDNKAPPYLQGVFLHTEGGQLIAVAMNGPRFAMYAVDAPYGVNLNGITIPSKNVDVLLSFLENVGDLFNVRFLVDDSNLTLDCADGRVATCLLDLKYPDYQKLIVRSEYPHTVDYVSLSAAIECCAPVGNKFTVVRHIDGEDGLAVEAWDYKGASGQCFVDMVGPALTSHVAFNSKFMLEALAGGRDVKIDFGDGVTPIRIQGEHDPEYMAGMMPMRVGLPVNA